MSLVSKILNWLSGVHPPGMGETENLTEGEPADEHQDDDGGQRHSEDSHAEDLLRHDFARKGLKGSSECSGIALDQHRSNYAVVLVELLDGLLLEGGLLFF